MSSFKLLAVICGICALHVVEVTATRYRNHGEHGHERRYRYHMRESWDRSEHHGHNKFGDHFPRVQASKHRISGEGRHRQYYRQPSNLQHARQSPNFQFLRQGPNSQPTRQFCQPRNEFEVRQQNLSCMRRCTMDSDCQNDRRLCLCDGPCGLSCIKPEKECQELPDPPNGQVHLTGRSFQDKAVYTCDDGYQIVGLSKVMCQASGSWSGDQPTCKAASGGAHSPYYCSKPPIIDNASHNGSQEQTFFDLDTGLTYRCFPGFKASGFDHAKCFYMNSTAMWYGPDLKCLPVDCGVPESIMHGRIRGDCYSFRCQIKYDCDPGFIVEGQSTRICQADGTWTRTQLPECKPVQCDMPNSPVNGKADFTAVSYMSVVSYDCNTGYMLVGNATRTCGSDRKWTGPTPECREINCGSPGGGHLPNGWLEGSRTNFRAVVTFRCIDGMVVEAESMTTTCRQDGTWSHPLPKCLAPCIVPQISNGISNTPMGTKIKHGQSILVNCTEMYEAGSENGELTCYNGTWSHLPRCDPARCKSMPTPPRNGMIVAPKTTHGAVGLYQCKDGYKLKGENTTRCNYGNWTGITPVCEEIYCEFPGYLTNGKILLVGNMGLYDYRPYVRKITNDRQIMFDCEKGYVLALGSPEGATCIDGHWSPGTIPNCVPENHPAIRWLDKRSIRKSDLEEAFPQLFRTKRKSEDRCPDLDSRAMHIKLLPSQAGESKIGVECKPGYSLISSSSEATCKDGVWQPETPKCQPNSCLLPNVEGGKFSGLKGDVKLTGSVADGESFLFSCQFGYHTLSKSSEVISCKLGELTGKPVCYGDPCVLPNINHGTYQQGLIVGQLLPHKADLDYSCQKGYSKENETPLRCKGGKILPSPPLCQPDKEKAWLSAPQADSPADAPCKYSSDEENLVAHFKDGRELRGEPMVQHGVTVLLRCSDIGKYKLNGANQISCSNGKFASELPTCEGLNQNYNYSEDLPPTILFRHENGPIAQSDIGELLVYPGTTLHMECLFQKRNGVPRWSHHNNTKKTYPQGWAQGHMRDSTLEYRLSIYFATELDSGDYTCSTPLNMSHTISIKVEKIDCPSIPQTNGLQVSTNQTRLGTQVRFGCTNGNNLVGSHTLTCIAGQRWSGLIPTCEQIICPDIRSVVKDPVMKISNDSSGRVFFACPSGYLINGDRAAFCQPNSEWSLPAPPTCKPVSCKNPKLSHNLMVHPTGPYKSGDVVKFFCKNGLLINGKPVAICNKNGEWSNESPYCVKACTYPGGIIRGTMDSIKFFYTVGEEVKFECSESYTMKGESVTKCLETGEWSNPVPLCLVKT